MNVICNQAGACPDALCPHRAPHDYTMSCSCYTHCGLAIGAAECVTVQESRPTDYQAEIAANVAARGYREGWKRGQFIARQVCKLTEEQAEASTHVRRPASNGPIWKREQEEAGESARLTFDNKDAWDDVFILDTDGLSSELADILVVLYSAAAALGVDLNEMALEKSQADIERGVR